MARHAAVDLAQIYDASPVPPDPDRLPADDFAKLCNLGESGLPLCDIDREGHRLAHLRRMYEPYVNSLGNHFLVPLPSWIFKPGAVDNWQTTAWQRTPARFEPSETQETSGNEHSW